MKKRSLSLLLALVMVFSLLPVFELSAAAANYTMSAANGDTAITIESGDTVVITGTENTSRGHDWSASPSSAVTITKSQGSTSRDTIATVVANTVTQTTVVTVTHTWWTGNSEAFTITINPKSVTPTPTPSTTPDDPINPGDIVDGNFVYSPAQSGLHVGDDIDLSQTYYVQVDGQWKEVTISKDTYYTAVANDGDTHNDRVVKTQKTDGYYGEPSAVSGWTPITGEGMYYMKDHNTFLPVQAENGTLTHDAYSNKLIAAKSGNTSDGMIVGPSESIGGWTTGESDVIVVDAAGNEHKVLYANKGSTFHYNMFIYYMDGNDVVYLTQGANESDGDSKYFSTYPGSPKSDTPTGVGKYYYTYNNTLGNYGGKGYYTGTYYRERSHQGKVALKYVDGGTTYWLSRSGVTTDASARTDAIHDHMVVYTGPLYQLQTLQRATYFSYEGGTPVESRLAGDQLTSLTLYTRRMSSDTVVIDDTDPDNAPDKMGTLVDTTNNFKGNLFIQKKLYRKDDGTYNIKLESWATGNMSTTGGEPMDVVLVVDLSHSMDLAGSDFTINGQSRIYYVRQAIEDFINTMYTANQNGADIRLAITSFANLRNEEGSWGSNGDNVYPTGIYNGSTFTRMKNATSTQYQNALMKVDDNGKTTLLKTLQHNNFEDPQGNSTHPEEGMDLAINILKNRTDATKNREPVIVFFTDGWPGYDSQDASKYAETALERANTLKAPKAQDGYDATIYSIGVFHFNDADTAHMHYALSGDTATFTVQSYMQHMSSMYNQTTLAELPGRTDHAKAPTNNTPDNTDQTYYYRIRTGTGAVNPLQELNDAFNNIATTIAETDVPVDTTSILRDVINENDFALPTYVASGENATVKVSEVPAKAINSRKQIEWNYAGEKTATGVTVSPIQDGAYLKGVNVSGYNYQSHFSAPNLADLSKSDLGDKLVVRIYGLMPKHGGEVYSNSEAGILNKPEGSSNFEMYLPVESPYDDIATRPYVVDFNASMKVAENAYLVSNTDNSRKYVTNITGNKSAAGQNNGSFAKDNNSTVTYQFLKKGIANGEQAAYDDYTFTGTDTALVFGQYYANGTRAESGKTTGDITTKQIVEGVKQDQTVAKAWQVVNMIPASSIYYDDDLTRKTVTVGDGSGYNSDVAATPSDTEKTGWTFAFTGTGIDIYCTTNEQGGIVQAMLDGDRSTIQNMRNYSVTERYNVPTFSFRGLEYGQHSITINTLSSSHYKFDGVRVYGPEEKQAVYEDTSEQYAAYINMREALVNDHGVDTAFEDNQMENEAVIGALFVDDANKIKHEQVATYWDPNVENEDGSKGAYVPDLDENGNERMVEVYKTDYAAYKANSPKHEIYLAYNGMELTDGTTASAQAIIFQLTPAGVTAAHDGHLWIGLSAPDANANGGTVKIGTKETSVTNAVDMYYPITEDMIGADRVVTLTNTGSTMISVTNLKITGNKDIYNAAADQKVGGNSTGESGATPSSIEDAVSMVFEPLTMQAVKIAANNGVDPDAVVTDDPGSTQDPGSTEDPGTTEDPTPEKPGWNDDAWNPTNILKTIFQLLLKSLSDLFSGLGSW